MPEFLQNRDSSKSVNAEKIEARRILNQARVSEKRVGKFMFQLFEDMRMKLRTGKERRVIMQEEQRLRLRSKWEKLIGRSPSW